MTANVRSDNRAKTYAIVLIASGIAAVGCFLCGTVGYWFYESRTFPSPAPYPGSAPKETWHRFRESGGVYYSNYFEYEVEQSLAKVKEHYASEMQRYCAPGWEFKDTNLLCGANGYAGCQVAECKIARPLADESQFFTVYVRPMSNGRMNVLYREKYKVFLD
jgi:hypothetical protein